MTTPAIAEANRAIRHAGEIAAIGGRHGINDDLADWFSQTPSKPQAKTPDWQLPTLVAGVLAYFAIADILAGIYVATAVAVLTVVAIGGPLYVIGPKVATRPTRRQRRARLLADCDAQHAAIMAGDEVTGTYGRFQPNFTVTDNGARVVHGPLT